MGSSSPSSSSCVFLGHHQPQPREQRHHVNGEGHEEGITPAPFQEIGLGKRQMQEQEQRAGDHEADGRAQLAQHRVPATTLRRRVQRQQRRQAVPGAAQRQALQASEHRQQRDGVHADHVIARQEGHAHGGRAQQEQRGGELGGAPSGAGWMDSAVPMGRAMKAKLKMTKDQSVPSSAGSNGKNTRGKTSTQAMPKTKKSKYSEVRPTMTPPRSRLAPPWRGRRVRPRPALERRGHDRDIAWWSPCDCSLKGGL